VRLLQKEGCWNFTRTSNKIIYYISSKLLLILLVLLLWLCSSLLGLGRFFSLLILYTVGRIAWTGDQPVARLLLTHRTTQIENKCTQTSMPRVGFEPMIAVLERAKTVHGLDRAATAIGIILVNANSKIQKGIWKELRYFERNKSRKQEIIKTFKAT
jgi:hypothetical protein